MDISSETRAKAADAGERTAGRVVPDPQPRRLGARDPGVRPGEEQARRQAVDHQAGPRTWRDRPPARQLEVMAGGSTAGDVTIDCPICGRRVTFPTTVTAPDYGDDGIGLRIELDMDAVMAHLLTHGPHDGKPAELLEAA